MNKGRLINYALNMLIANADDMAEEDLNMTAEEIEAEVQDIKDNCVLVVEEDGWLTLNDE